MMDNFDQQCLPPADLFACPRCYAKTGAGFNLSQLRCENCQLEFFSLDGTACLFPHGLMQRELWEHQVADLAKALDHSNQALQAELSRFDLSPATRRRLEKVAKDTDIGQRLTIDLLQSAGLKARFSEQFQSLRGAVMTEYYQQILRDWAWDDAPNNHFKTNENDAALERLLATLDNTQEPPQRVLFLGAGAGRLSWDLHTHLQPEFTIALDSNPLLLAASNKLIRHRQTIKLTGFNEFPQFDSEGSHTWTIEPPSADDKLHQSWFALGANAWNAPFTPHQFDLVVTAWFIDVNDGDLRDFLHLMQLLLKPGGQWLNSGPLLYGPSVPISAKYTGDEIRELLMLAGFTLESERLDMSAHLVSPIEQRFREEQIWTFSAKSPSPAHTTATNHPTPWLILHHLPIPKYEQIPTHPNPITRAILDAIDGTISINQLSQKVAHLLPKDTSPNKYIAAVLGELLEQRQHPS